MLRFTLFHPVVSGTLLLLLLFPPAPTYAREAAAASSADKQPASSSSSTTSTKAQSGKEKPGTGGEAASGGLTKPRVVASRRGFEQLEEGPGYKILTPAHAYGRPMAVHRLRDALERYHTRYPEAAPIVIMDISRRNGGPLQPHASHRTGRDADVRLVLNRPVTGFVDATPRTLDVERTWFLISTLIDNGDVEYIFLNRVLQKPLYKYAVSLGCDKGRLDEIFQRRREKVGIIRHEMGHLNHFHVRFRKTPSLEPPSRDSCRLGPLAFSRTECHGLSSPLYKL